MTFHEAIEKYVAQDPVNRELREAKAIDAIYDAENK